MNPKGMRMRSGEGFLMKNLICSYTVQLVDKVFKYSQFSWAGYVGSMYEGMI